MASEHERQPFQAIDGRSAGDHPESTAWGANRPVRFEEPDPDPYPYYPYAMGSSSDLSQSPPNRSREPEDYLWFDDRDERADPGDARPGGPDATNWQGPDGYDDYDDELEYDAYFDDDDDDDFVDATSRITRNALEWAVVLVGAMLVALLLRASLFQAFYIPSESMETTLAINDRVLVNKVSYRLHDINRGDIVVFVRPDDQEGEIRDLIKRVIALPGETVEGRDNALYINGQLLTEPYLDPGIVTTDFGPTVIPEGEIFVMGDNRSESYDSRLFGTVSEDRVVGRAFVLFWPVNRFGSL